MKEAFIEFIRKFGFSEANNAVNYKIRPTYYEVGNFFLYATIDGIEYFGIYIYKNDLKDTQFKEIFQYIKKNQISIHTFFCNNSNLRSFSFDSKDFPNLSSLNLSHNDNLFNVKLSNFKGIENVTITKCKNLTEVYIYNIGENINKIDVSGCNISKLTLPISLPNLKELLINDNNIASYGFLAFTQNRTNLDLTRLIYDKNPISVILKEILKDNEVQKLNSFIVDLWKPSCLNKLRNLSPQIKDIESIYYQSIESKIVFLDLGNQELKDIPAQITDFEDLETLVIGAMYFWDGADRPSKGEKLNNDFSNANNLDVLNKLPALVNLFLSSCNVYDLEFLQEHRNLRILDLTKNHAIKGNLNLLSVLENRLEKLFLGYNNLDNNDLLVFEGGKFKNLELLALQHNNIQSITAIEHFFKDPTVTVFLNANKIADIREFKDVLLTPFHRIKLNNDSTKAVFISENPIDESILPYFTIDNGDLRVEMFKNYFELLSKTTIKSAKRLKLIFLGNTSAGKTTFYDFLKNDNKANGDSTHGMNLFTYETPKGTFVQGYDFGGQDYYHNNHSPYFSENAHYFLIWGNGQKDEFNIKDNGDYLFPLRYWLGSLNCILKERNSTVNIDLIYNVRNGVESEELNLKDLKSEYKSKNIIIENNFSYPLNECKIQQIIEQEKNNKEKEVKKQKNEERKNESEEIDLKTIRSNIDNILDKRAKEISINELTEDFNKELKNSELILVSIKDLEKFKSYKETSSEQRMTLVNLSHNSFGCYYQPYIKEASVEEIPEILKGYLIVDLERFNALVYKVLLKEKDGYFKKDEAKTRILNFLEEQKWDVKNKVGDVEIDFFISFMLHHKIIFEIKKDDNSQYVSPVFLTSHLNETEKLFLNTFEEPILKYEFKEYFHINVFTEIITEFLAYLILEKRETGWRYVMWKNKIILYELGEENVKKLLYLDFDWVKDAEKNEHRPIIKIKQTIKNRVSDKFFKENIVNELDLLLNEYKPVKWVSDKYHNFIPFEKLEEENSDGAGKMSDLIYYNKKILRKGDFRIFLKDDKYKMKKIFISYSKFDEQYKDEFKEHLINLRREGLVDTFDDRQLELGEKWDQTLKQKIDECDYFVCLVSVKFLNVRYIYEEEIPRALANGKKIIPIIIKPCDWENTPIKQFQNNDDHDGVNSKLGDFNAHNKGRLIGLNPDFVNAKEEKEIREYTSTERDFMWVSVIKKIRESIEKDQFR